MAIEPIGSVEASDVSKAGQTPQSPQPAEELTTVTTHCDKQHKHDQSCPHTVTTRPAPRPGQSGYFIDKKV